ncbi:MAG TPA: hypothetical protein VGK29_04310 [Paludibaculum sp.]|jgi:hypothetical protein
MATAAQIAANQANARRSTGPRTAEGKTASARNATTHGLSSQDFVILAGQEQEFDQFMAELEAEIQPAGAIERELFAQHAHAAWTLRRCRRAEVASQFGHVCEGGDPLLFFDMANRLKRIDLYMRRAERTYHKTLKELRAFQTNRLSTQAPEPLESGVQPSAPPVLVNVAQLHRQHTAIVRAQASFDKAQLDACLQDTLFKLNQEFVQPAPGNLTNRTQSTDSSTLAAGSSR